MRIIPQFIRNRLGRSGYLPLRNILALDQIGWLESFKTNQPIDSAHQPVPWFTYAAISFLDQIVREEASVLEIGGGNSSLWWASRGCAVTVVESDENWATELRNKGVHNVTVVHDVDEVRSLLQNLYASGLRFGVVVVDGIEPRDRYLNEAGALVDESGVLVVDNSDRVAYRSCLDGLEGLHRFDFFGMGPQNPYAWATSVFSRKGVLPEGRRDPFSRALDY